MRATSSGCRQPWPGPAEADGLAPGLAVEPAAPEGPGDLGERDDGDPDGLADDDPDDAGAELDAAGAEPDGDPEGPADGDPDCDPGGADALGWAGGTSCVQAAMITRSLAGSGLPPMPPRSTK